ncbi:MAG TPA: hypothetical protein VI893_09530 [Thermoplasmata archaeon]|nr:hypothetical protein [Thermoplasmata archaeon]
MDAQENMCWLLNMRVGIKSPYRNESHDLERLQVSIGSMVRPGDSLKGVNISLSHTDSEWGQHFFQSVSRPASGKKKYRGARPSGMTWAYYNFGPMCACHYFGDDIFEAGAPRRARIRWVPELLGKILELPLVCEVQLRWCWSGPGEKKATRKLTIEEFSYENEQNKLDADIIYCVGRKER